MRRPFSFLAVAAVAAAGIAYLWIWHGGDYGMTSGREFRALASERLGALAAVYPPVDGRARSTAADARNGRPWIAGSLAVAEAALRAHPPRQGDGKTRREALLLTDLAVNADRSAGWDEAVGAHFRSQAGRAMDEIESAPVPSGIRAWKIYNMGFVVKSPQAVIGFDVHPGWGFDAALTGGQMDRLVSLLDVLFISHGHPDHLSNAVVGRMLSAGKPIVMPDRIRVDLEDRGVIRLYNSHDGPRRVGPVEVIAWPGRQGGLAWARNAVFLVRTGGMTIVHTGDNTDTKLYRDLAAGHRIDLLLCNCWTGIEAPVNALRPRVFAVGHENDVRHPRGLRPSFRRTFGAIDRMGLTPPWATGGPEPVVLSWGEGFAVEPFRPYPARGRNTVWSPTSSSIARATSTPSPSSTPRSCAGSSRQRSLPCCLCIAGIHAAIWRRI